MLACSDLKKYSAHFGISPQLLVWPIDIPHLVVSNELWLPLIPTPSFSTAEPCFTFSLQNIALPRALSGFATALSHFAHHQIRTCDHQ
jgi:hypothetical protein